MTIHIDAQRLREDQNEDDRFELYFGQHHDPFWLNEAEVIAFRSQLDCALGAYRAAYQQLPEGSEVANV